MVTMLQLMATTLGAVGIWRLTRLVVDLVERRQARGAPATGGATSGDDLVERMARCLAEHTARFGSSYVVPDRLHVELPAALAGAAGTAVDQLAAEVRLRFVELMVEQQILDGRADFALSTAYELRIRVGRSDQERITASFSPSTATDAGCAPDPSAPTGRTVVLRVAGVLRHRRLLRMNGKVAIGSDRDNDIVCRSWHPGPSPFQLVLTRDGVLRATSLDPRAPTWLLRTDDPPVQLALGRATEIGAADVLWLDRAGHVTVRVKCS